MATRSPSAAQAAGDAAADALRGSGDQYRLDGFQDVGITLPDLRAPRSSSGSTPGLAPARARRPVQFAHPQKTAVVELRTPAIAPMVRGLHVLRTRFRRPHREHHHGPCIVSMVANTRPRNSFGTCRSSCHMFSTELTATAARDSAMNTSAQREAAHLAEQNIRSRRAPRSRSRWCACKFES